MLPLPVARLRRRSLNSKSPKDRHDYAWFAFEASVKLAVAGNPPRDTAPLARASLGVWVAALRLPETKLHSPAALRLFELLSESSAGSTTPRRTVTPRELCGNLAGYRNHTIGHASVKGSAFYMHASAVLLEGLEECWRIGLFLPEGAQLTYVDTVELGSDGRAYARILDLSTENPLASHGLPVPDGIGPKRVVIRTGAVWRSLHPWVLFQEEPEQFLVLNTFSRQAEYLEYATGEHVRGSAAELVAPGVTKDLREMFGGSAAAAASTESDPSPMVGRRLGGFELLGELGRGGMGIVWLARHPTMRRLVALKTLPAPHSENATARARFHREVRALAKCDHPNVVKVLTSGEDAGTPFVAMEYVIGVDLRAVEAEFSVDHDFGLSCQRALGKAREARARLHPELAANPLGADDHRRPKNGWVAFTEFFRDAARGVQHLHEQGILHRDLSPANVMVNDGDHRAVVMDLGLAAVEDASVTLTRDKSQVLGTLRYLAPDHFTRKIQDIDERADVYALGAVMYELAAGDCLFDGTTEARLMQQILSEDPRQLRSLNPDVPPDLEFVIARAIAKRRDVRHASMRELAEDLDRLSSGASPIGQDSRSHGVRADGNGRVLALGAALAAAILAMVFLWGRNAESAAVKHGVEAAPAVPLAVGPDNGPARGPDAPGPSIDTDDAQAAGVSSLGLEGFTLVSRSEWGALEPNTAKMERGPSGGGWKRITIHHTATVDSEDAPGSGVDSFELMRQIQQSHRDSAETKYGDIGYHFVVDPQGRILEGRSLEWQGAHAKGDNNVANIGVCVMGNFDRDHPSAAALEGLRSLVDGLRSQFGIPQSQVFGHGQLTTTQCPGKFLQAWIVEYVQG